MLPVLNLLESYLPQGACELAGGWLSVPGLSVKLVNRGQIRLGSYQHKNNGLKVITLNVRQDIYSFLVTLAHEVAHMQVVQVYGRRAAPHGPEWKDTFGNLLKEASQLPSLPPDIRQAMLFTAANPRSTHFSHPQTSRTFLKHSNNAKETILLHDLPEGTRFIMPNGRIYIKGEKRRTRFKCSLDGTSRFFLIGGSAPVLRVA